MAKEKINVLEHILGKTVTKIEGLEKDSDEVLFTFDDGSTLLLHHEQECCEGFWLEDIAGDGDDLIGSPILKFETVTKEGDSIDYESQTWTFIKIATVKGYVDLRFIGSSNGYYSEMCDFKYTPKGEESFNGCFGYEEEADKQTAYRYY